MDHERSLIRGLRPGLAESISKALSLSLSSNRRNRNGAIAPVSTLYLSLSLSLFLSPPVPPSFLYAFSFAPIDLVFLARCEPLRPANPVRVSDLLTLFANAARTAGFVRNYYPDFLPLSLSSVRQPHGLDIQISLIDLRNKSPG